MDITVRIECAQCGKELDVEQADNYTRGRYDGTKLIVTPCDSCAAKSYEEGRTAGIDEEQGREKPE